MQRVPGLLSLAQKAVDRALAHAERGEDDVVRLHLPDDHIEEERTERQGLLAARRQTVETLQGCRRTVGVARRDLQGFAGIEAIAVNGRQRIARLAHVKLRERAPRSADGVKCLAAHLAEPILGRQTLLDQRDGFGLLALGLVHERKTSERQRNLMIERLALKPDQLDAAAAQVANNAGGVFEPCQNARRRQFRLFGVADDPDRHPAGLLGARQKLRSVLRPPHRCGCKGVDVARAARRRCRQACESGRAKTAPRVWFFRSAAASN